jgi:lipopolysaccharide transport system permease protein
MTPIDCRPVRIIQPSARWSTYRLLDLWRHRELLYFLAWRDIKVRYRQTFLGVAWAILQPLTMMALFTIVFGRFTTLQNATGGIPYAPYALVGLVPWTFFAAAVNSSSQSIALNAQLVTKTSFPRFLIPLAAGSAALMDFLFAFAALLLLLVFYGIGFTWQAALVPILIVGMLIAAFGVGSLFAALAVSYRDFRFIVPFLLQVWLFSSPVIYPASLVPDIWYWILLLNPLSGLIGGFRASLLSQPVPWAEVATALSLCVAWFVGGTIYFRRVERDFADVI